MLGVGLWYTPHVGGYVVSVLLALLVVLYPVILSLSGIYVLHRFIETRGGASWSTWPLLSKHLY